MTTYYTYYASPIDPILLTSDGVALTGLYMVEQKHGPEIAPDWVHSDDAAPFAEAKRQLAGYFAGTSTEFDLPLAPQGTEFQRRVWAELTRIPYGETISYGVLARRIGQPGSARAVGLANGRNPISIVVPCHRVIGSNGKLVGYGGGLARKQALLSHEAGETAPVSTPITLELELSA
jgi:methylated-DNA-[protein]-cysteine S-methyltransferase